MHRIFFVLARFSHLFTAFFACLQVLHLALGSFCPFLFLRICIFCLVLSLHSYLFNYFSGGGFSNFFAHWHVSLHVSAQSHSCFHCSIFSAYILAYFSHDLCLFLTASGFSPNIRPLFQPIRINFGLPVFCFLHNFDALACRRFSAHAHDFLRLRTLLLLVNIAVEPHVCAKRFYAEIMKPMSPGGTNP